MTPRGEPMDEDPEEGEQEPEEEEARDGGAEREENGGGQSIGQVPDSLGLPWNTNAHGCFFIPSVIARLC